MKCKIQIIHGHPDYSQTRTLNLNSLCILKIIISWFRRYFKRAVKTKDANNVIERINLPLTTIANGKTLYVQIIIRVLIRIWHFVFWIAKIYYFSLARLLIYIWNPVWYGSYLILAIRKRFSPIINLYRFTISCKEKFVFGLSQVWW